jgi:hypothetical protein
MSPAVIEILGLVDGSPSPFDGEFLVEFDPDRPGIAPDGRPIIFHLVTTTDRTEARVFAEWHEAHEFWRQVSREDPIRPDGEPNRPLTMFTVAIEAAGGG